MPPPSACKRHPLYTESPGSSAALVAMLGRAGELRDQPMKLPVAGARMLPGKDGKIDPMEFFAFYSGGARRQRHLSHLSITHSSSTH